GVTGLVLVGGGRVFRRSFSFVVYFRGSVAGLGVGAPVKFKGVEIGRVTEVYVQVSHPSRDRADVRIPVLIALDPERVGSDAIGDRVQMVLLVDDGLRAQLATASFVTNLRYVALDLFPGSPKELVGDRSLPYLEIPTLPNDLENAEKEASDVLAHLARVD